MNIESHLLNIMTERIRKAINPTLIILFGSRARNQANQQSDYDILVVAPSSLPRWKRAIPLYRILAGIGAAKDILWWTPEEIEEWKSVRSHFIFSIFKEGKILYENSPGHGLGIAFKSRT